MRVFLLLSVLLSVAVSARSDKVYTPQTVTGKYQKLGTITPISPKNRDSAEIAVILVPGLNHVNESKYLYEWDRLWWKWQQRRSELTNYCPFVLRYGGWDSIHSSAKVLVQGIEEILQQQQNIKKLILIGYSQGGLLCRVALSEHPELEDVVIRVITTAAAHEGAPPLTEKLLRDAFEHYNNPLIAWRDSKVLDILSQRYWHAYHEQAWTNFDNGIPPSANYTPPEEALEMPTPAHPEKFITYGSYYFPPDSSEGRMNFFFRESIPRMLADTRAGQASLHRIMSQRIYIDEKPSLREHMRLNDGVTPLVSSLWGQMCGEKVQPESWARVFPSNNFCPVSGNYRAFEGMDHLAWRQPRYLSKKLDHMHPELPRKHIYDWIIDDILSDD